MVILDADPGRAVHRPAKGDAPLVVDTNRVEPAPIALQGFEPVPGGTAMSSSVPAWLSWINFLSATRAKAENRRFRSSWKSCSVS
jgi:hypothetical protein